MSTPAPTRERRGRRGPSTSRIVVIVASIVVGLAMMIGAAPIQNSWWQSVLIQVGSSVLLLAPLAYLEDYVRRSFGELNASLRTSVAGISAVRNLLPPGDRRTAIFDDLLKAVRERAEQGEFPPSDVDVLLAGDGDDRTVALAAMVGDRALADARSICRSIRRPANGNEQYYALLAAESAWADLGVAPRGRVLNAIRKDGSARGWIVADPDRRRIADGLQRAGADDP